jgi:rhodanese-related sulfurtransferase
MYLKLKSRLRYIAFAFLSLVVISGSVLAACAPRNADVLEVVDLTAPEASALIDENTSNPGFFIMDVRTPEEFAAGHIDRAVNINLALKDFRTRLDDLERKDIYLVYCRSGNRSAQAIEVMKDLRFEKIYHLSSGISGWMAAGFEVVR